MSKTPRLQRKGSRLVPTSTHWGNYLVETADGAIVDVHAYAEDLEPTPIRHSLKNALDGKCRVPRPMIREGYLEKRWGSDTRGRGIEPFVAVPWDEALDIAAEALDRVRTKFGNESIFGGNYGWASAGRFHHANSQIHRFLNMLGGYCDAMDSYSAGAAEVITRRVLGMDFYHLMFQSPTAADVREHTRLVVCFGGIALKNTQVMQGGLGAHTAVDQLQRVKERGIRFVNVSPIRDDVGAFLDAEWWPCRPNSDTAIMLGLAHTLVTGNLHDRDFLERYCTGFGEFLPYLMGERDGVPKDAEWAAALSEIPAAQIRELARAMAAERCLIGISWSLQRAEFGEQPYWMATMLGAMLGGIGLPGAGVAYGYGSIHNIGFGGRRVPNFKVGALPQGRNPVQAFIPVARISDMLLNPGAPFEYDGQSLVYPDIRLIYWAGGNPFHHHQDLNRLRRAWQKPETVIINEPFWTASARRADIVFPGTTSLERNDIAGSSYDRCLTPMHKAVEPFAESRSDYEIFSALAARLGFGDAFTEGRDEMQWVRHLYEVTVANAKAAGVALPPFDEFWSGTQLDIADRVPDWIFDLERFRADPGANPLETPSGRIELFSGTVAGFGYTDCIGHPCWYDREEWLGAERARRYPLHLISNQPKTRLHSQYDHGITSRNAKISGRAPARMNTLDAQRRGLKDGDIIRIFNDRGACLAGVTLTDTIRESVMELETGAWFDPLDETDPMSLEVHGNPNAVTRDTGTSRLAQSCTAHSCLVEVEKYRGELPPVKVFDPPPCK